MNTTDIPPNQTLYVSNLYEKLKKEELKKVLYACFSPHGKIIDVVAVKSFRLRGQAWVVFDEVASAAEALRALQGFPLFDKPMRIQYARGKSDAVAKVGAIHPPDMRTHSTPHHHHTIITRRMVRIDHGTPRPRLHTTSQPEKPCKNGVQSAAPASPPPLWSPKPQQGALCRAPMEPPRRRWCRRATPNPTRFCLCRICRKPPTATCLPCCFSSLLGLKKCAWSRGGRALRLWSLTTRCSRVWRSAICRISRLRPRTPCTFPMQSSRELLYLQGERACNRACRDWWWLVY